jgi:hypothetical protein
MHCSRLGITNTPVANGENVVPPKKSREPTPKSLALPATLETLIERAKQGDESVMPQLRQFLNSPHGPSYFLDLAGNVRRAFIRRFARDDRITRELIEREMRKLRAELIGSAPTSIERLLAERVAIGWLEVNTAEFHLASCDPVNRHHWQRQVDHANRRFLAALRLLTNVRRLPRPAVQINVGEQQVNVSG